MTYIEKEVKKYAKKINDAYRTNKGLFGVLFEANEGLRLNWTFKKVKQFCEYVKFYGYDIKTIEKILWRYVRNGTN